MPFVVSFLVATAAAWVTLLIVIPLAQKLADFSLPPLPEMLWKLAVVAAAGNAISVALNPVSPFLSWVVGAAVFFGLLYKWFDIDLFAAVIIVVVSWIVRTWIAATLMLALAP